MFGAARILLYKTKLFQDALFTEYRELYNVKSSREAEFDISLAFKEVECPRIDTLYNRREAREMHLMTEYPAFIEHAMQESYFGVLTDSELEMFLSLQTEDQFLCGMRRFPTDRPEEIREQTMQQLALTDVVNYMSEILKDWDQQLQFVEESMQQTVQADAADYNAQDEQVAEPSILREGPATSETDEHPATSRKRPATSEPDEHPAKRRKILEISSEEVRVPRRRRRRFADEEKVVSSEVLGKRIGNVAFKTTASPYTQILQDPRRHGIHSHTAECDFGQPRLAAAHRQVFASKLTKNFLKLVTRPVTETEFPELDFDLPLADLEPEETVREDAPSKIHERTYDISNKLAVTAAESSEQPITAEQSPINISQEFPKVQTDKSAAALPEISGFDKTVREDAQSKLHERTVDISSKLAVTFAENGEQSKTAEQFPIKTPQLPKKKILKEFPKIQTDKSAAALPGISGFEETIGEPAELSPTTKHFSPNAALTNKELSALLEVYWDQGKPHPGLTTFQEIIPPDSYTKIDAARAFATLLGFHAEKRVVLQQAKPYDSIWIGKCSGHYSGSSESTV
ncbi:uncharacterized protein LOC143217620 [Lasioglossum baleicum]|uniref:uncharacterized protein LOC143217620 n=1 Tax=Lasioglossum baleicum TaxID=434251 RepID=UPI003FCCCB74